MSVILTQLTYRPSVSGNGYSIRMIRSFRAAVEYSKSVVMIAVKLRVPIWLLLKSTRGLTTFLI